MRSSPTIQSPVRCALNAIIVCVLFVVSAPHAAAQDGREEFLRGSRAADELRWADALEHFRRAYTLSHNPVALYDAATTLKVLGRYVEARDALDELERAHQDLASDLRDGATQLRQDVEARIARLAVTLPDLAALELRIDGQLRALAPIVELDPGRHALLASAPDRVPFEWRGVLEAGQTLPLSIALDPAPHDRTAEHWLVGSLSGAGALALIAAAIAIGLVVHDGAQLAPRTDVVLRP